MQNLVKKKKKQYREKPNWKLDSSKKKGYKIYALMMPVETV